MNNSENAKRLAKILSRTRNEVGLSQEDMALELGVSRMTVSNWEKGTSRCDMVQFFHWFEALGKNPIPYVLQFFTPDTFEDLEHSSSDERIDEAVEELLQSLSNESKRSILYLLYGIAGDPFAMLQLFVAHSHLPMEYRFSIANHICEAYKMCEANGTLKDTDKIKPDIALLEEAIEAGKDAAITGKATYQIKRPTD